MKFETRCARGAEPVQTGRPIGPTIVPSSNFAFENQAAVDRYFETGEGYVYSRYTNPTVLQAEGFLARLEGTPSALLFASGMAAISTTFLSLVGSGDRVAAQRELYGGSVELLDSFLPGLGIEVRWLGFDDVATLTPEKLDGCKLLYAETPVNPTLGVIDLARTAEAVHRAGALMIVDSTFATPALQRPAAAGVDYVIHSASKYLGGHGDLIGGAVAGNADALKPIERKRRALGGAMDPFTAFLLMRGMRTLAVRMEAHCERARAVAGALAAHSAVERVFYPGLPEHPGHDVARKQMNGFGGMVSFCVAGGKEAAVRVHDGLQLFARAGSLGGVESLVSIPAGMSHRGLAPAERARVGVADTLLRLSVGLEAAEDLIEDLHRALERA